MILLNSFSYNIAWTYLVLLCAESKVQAFQHHLQRPHHHPSQLDLSHHVVPSPTRTTNSNSNKSIHLCATENDENMVKSSDVVEKTKKREKVMAFLRKVGAVGGNKDFTTAMGVDEGPVGKNSNPMKEIAKTKSAYKWCTETGLIDDMSQPFPGSASGSEWAGFTDQVMGGISKGICTRETVEGRQCNVMKGKVSLYNNGGFIQMATALSTDPAKSLTVDASNFDGVELDVLYNGEDDVEKFNVHLRNSACLRQFSSYRGTFTCNNGKSWETVKIPFSDFVGYGPGSSETPFDPSELRRLGIVAIGKAMEVYLAVSGVRFYKN
mmetsp:Transcript_23744/g.27464  ORF Transcript_23744/g.27464 Transcript_23744/m.27464 type:complete len:323 (-) Transcript_23744:165-1133(-)